MAPMKYVSTRGRSPPLTFAETVLAGLAPDGGLYLPAEIPRIENPLLEAWRRLPYRDLAFEIIRLYADLPVTELRRMIERSYAVFDVPDVCPVRRAGEVFLAELFHGPTLAFKDIALQLLGNLFEYVLAERGGQLNILAATSGDTGSAAIHGVRGRRNIRIFVMHPHKRVSPLQERQMTSVLDPNVFNIAIEGTFDDCQNLMKRIFGDPDYKVRHSLGSVNSINWARIAAQTVYYFHAAFRVMEQTGAAKVRFTVPTGNFGDIFAGFLAARMGLPIERLVLATNTNDILARYFATGEYRCGRLQPTISPSMDIQVASNFERYLYLRAGGDAARVRTWMDEFKRDGRIVTGAARDGVVDPLLRGGAASEADTLAAIREFDARHHCLIDPHTAVGVHVALSHLAADAPMICLATAHPAKFPDAVRRATGRDAAHHPILDALESLPTRCQVLAADERAVRAFVEKAIGGSR